MQFDYIIVGSGINSLVCAALLSRKGARVAVLERETAAGGCVKTAEVTLPGFRHDAMSGFYPEFLASAAFAELGDELKAHGLEFLNTNYPTGVLLPNGRYFILKTDRAANIASLNDIYPGDGDTFDADMSDFAASAHISFGLLGNEVLSWAVIRMLISEWQKVGLEGITSFFGKAVRTARTWGQEYHSKEVRACLLPWVLHAGMDIDGAMSGYMGRVFAFAIEAMGMPVVKGGSENIVTAFEGLIRKNKGELITGVDVKSIIMKNNKADGVLDSNGNKYFARKAVICNVTPTQLYHEVGLLKEAKIPDTIRARARKYQYGRGNMIIHLALDRKPNWPSDELSKVAMLHVGDGIEQTTKSLADVRNGYLPARATIAVGQKAAVDPSRVPEGKFSLWLQLHEIPRELKGDVAGVIEVSEGWNDAVKEQYADRVIDQLSEFAPGLKSLILARNVYSPKDLEALNINLVGGDPYSGANTMDQFLFWRPLRGVKGHKTPVKNVYHIGASTHPGPGLGATSGYLVGRSLS